MSWWDVSQATADGTSVVPSFLWRIRDRGTVTSPKVVLKVKGRVPRRLCYANANLARADQPTEVMRFVEFWHAVTGHDPRWLYIDSKVVDYPELSRIDA